jgi:Beta-lactamase enzyme family
LIKLPILAAFWETVEAGRLDPRERVTVSAEALRVEGTGVLKALAPGLQPTWSDLATLMITVSDNVATNLIIDRLGMGPIQSWIDKAGLGETRIERRMMDREAMSAGRGNWTSAADMEAMLIARRGDVCVWWGVAGDAAGVGGAADSGSAAAAAGCGRARGEQDGELCGCDPRRGHRAVLMRDVGDRDHDGGRTARMAGDGFNCRDRGSAHSVVPRIILSTHSRRLHESYDSCSSMS